MLVLSFEALFPYMPCDGEAVDFHDKSDLLHQAFHFRTPIQLICY